MGDKITILKIELLSNDLFQIDFKNETTGEISRTFFGKDKLYDMLNDAKSRKSHKDYQFNLLVSIIKGNTNHELGYPIDNDVAELVANRLIDNGVIVLPCEVGTTVYLPYLSDENEIIKYNIISFKYEERCGLQFQIDDEDGDFHSVDLLGTEVFFTKEDALSHLGIKKNDGE